MGNGLRRVALIPCPSSDSTAAQRGLRLRRFRLGNRNEISSGQTPQAQALVDDFVSVIQSAGYLPLPISLEHALRAGSLAPEHKDPFDRMIAAQSIHEDMALISNDERLDIFGVRREW